MKRQLDLDTNRLWRLAQQGKSAQEIMAELDISEMATLKNALENLMKEKGETINVRGLVGKTSVENRYTDKGNRIPPDM